MVWFSSYLTNRCKINLKKSRTKLVYTWSLRLKNWPFSLPTICEIYTIYILGTYRVFHFNLKKKVQQK